jgi:hypothetical protein
MKRWHFLYFGLIVLSFLIWAVPPQALGQGRGQGFRPCPYAPYQCPGVCLTHHPNTKKFQLWAPKIKKAGNLYVANLL